MFDCQTAVMYCVAVVRVVVRVVVRMVVYA